MYQKRAYATTYSIISSMIDDLKYIHQRDSKDALGVAEKQWQQLEHDFNCQSTSVEIDNIVLAGMGGSALAGKLSQSWPGHSVPFEICSNYSIPEYVGRETLFIASSYSGNTEETLSALDEAEKKGAQVAVITSGGKLKEIAEEKGYPLVLLPSGYQPRTTAYFGLNALITVLDSFGLVDGSRLKAELKEAAKFIKDEVSNWTADIPAAKNPAKKLARELMGLSPVIYSGPLLWPAAYKWKISINENAKNVAWCNQYPEFNHNEFIGWSSHPVEKLYSVIDLRSSLDNPQIKKRFEISDRLLSGRRPASHTVEVAGDTPINQLLWAVAYGDFVSIYLAILNGVDPTPVDLIEKLKGALAN